MVANVERREAGATIRLAEDLITEAALVSGRGCWSEVVARWRSRARGRKRIQSSPASTVELFLSERQFG